MGLGMVLSSLRFDFSEHSEFCARSGAHSSSPSAKSHSSLVLGSARARAGPRPLRRSGCSAPRP
eukprot:8699524-Alexandrium_andersonii.AAC.1